jgi:succinoglycan biosynthesis transport protein ExoP
LHHDSSLRDYVRIARRRKWIILQAVVLVPFAAIAFSLRQEPLYQSFADVLLSNQNLAGALTGTPSLSGSSTPERVAETQAALARVPKIAEAALREVGLSRRASDLLVNSSVSTSPNSDLIRFTVTDPNASLAKRLATAYAHQYTVYRQKLDTASLRNARSEVGDRIKELAAAGDKRSALYQSLLEKDQQLATIEALQTSNASLVKPADAAVQIQPKPIRNGLLGFALGSMVGIGLAFLWEALDTRVRKGEEIAERLGLPLLGRLPEPPRRLRKENQIIMLARPRGDDSEPFRMLRTNLEFARLGHDVRTIMVTSSVEREGKSTTVANLAVALARSGQRVALVDLDLRRPFLDRFFDVRQRPGLTQVAIGQSRLAEALVPVPIREPSDTLRPKPIAKDLAGAKALPTLPSLLGGSLSVIVAGTIPPNAGEFVGSDALGEILLELRERFDTVLIDAPPALSLGDAMALSRSVDGLIVITRLKVVRRAMLHELHRMLESSPARKLGFVLTDTRNEDGYGEGYGYGYGYGNSPAASSIHVQQAASS